MPRRSMSPMPAIPRRGARATAASRNGPTMVRSGPSSTRSPTRTLSPPPAATTAAHGETGFEGPHRERYQRWRGPPLYAVSYTAGDADPNGLYGITDTLTATRHRPGQSFTEDRRGPRPPRLRGQTLGLYLQGCLLCADRVAGERLGRQQRHGLRRDPERHRQSRRHRHAGLLRVRHIHVLRNSHEPAGHRQRNEPLQAS